jgi:hypothetical protein
MGDNFKTTLETLAASMQSLQTAIKANAAAIQALAADQPSSSSNRPRSGTGEHHNDRPLRFQKMDFPRYDASPIPSSSSIAASRTFISNASWRRRRYGWHHTTLKMGRNCGTCKSKRTKGPRRGAGSRSCSTCATVRPYVPLHSLSSQTAPAPPPSRSTRTVFKRSWLAPDLSTSAAVHRRSSTTAQLRRAGPQSAVPRGCHEPGPATGAAGAVHRGVTPPSRPWSSSCSGPTPGPAGTASA